MPSLSQSRQISHSFKVFVSNLCNCTLLEILQADYCGLQTYKHSHIQQYATLFGFMYNKLLSKHYIVRRCCIATLLLLLTTRCAVFRFPKQPTAFSCRCVTVVLLYKFAYNRNFVVSLRALTYVGATATACCYISFCAIKYISYTLFFLSFVAATRLQLCHQVSLNFSPSYYLSLRLRIDRATIQQFRMCVWTQ